MARTLAFVMAGGAGRRLEPLTRYRAKPAVPFGGCYRIIDFVLSNLVNSGITAIYVLTQYKAQAVIEHIQDGWAHRLVGRDSFIRVVPAQMQLGETWYRGTADSVYQNLNLMHQFAPEVVIVFGADHIYKMNIGQMIDFHLQCGAKATVACLPVPRGQASSFGILDANGCSRVTAFLEKPSDPPSMPGKPGFSLASMGNYAFEPQTLVESLSSLASTPGSNHDFGGDIIPALMRAGMVYAYDFSQNRIPRVRASEEAAYWRDVGTIEAYYEANLDLKNVEPQLNLYNWNWPIVTANFNDPPVKMVFDDFNRRGIAIQSIISPGCILAGGYVKDSVLGRNVTLEAGCEVHESILMNNVHIGPGCRVRAAIIDKNVCLDACQTVGYDLDADRRRYHVSPSGIVVVPKTAETPETLARNV